MQWAPRAPPALAPGLGARGESKEADGQEGDDESTARFWFPSPVVDPINVPLPYDRGFFGYFFVLVDERVKASPCRVSFVL